MQVALPVILCSLTCLLLVVTHFIPHEFSKVVLAEVKELYQQYGGGIPKHINGIRRFAHQMYTLSQEKPVGLFLIGFDYLVLAAFG